MITKELDIDIQAFVGQLYHDEENNIQSQLDGLQTGSP